MTELTRLTDRHGSAPPVRVLIVEDNADSAESLVLLLQMQGNDVEHAIDGAGAIAAAESHRPDVVLLDIGLPGMSGYEVARRIRQEPWGEGMLLVALTGWGQKEDKEQSREAGFDHHLVKPVDPALLVPLFEKLRAGKQT